ncbi:MAG TPA: hypothetical protein PLR99_23930, partial [Polyangiaceae bacterium]|nr:hypothetical protein [Polyangiaceae bacterium]
ERGMGERGEWEREGNGRERGMGERGMLVVNPERAPAAFESGGAPRARSLSLSLSPSLGARLRRAWSGWILRCPCLGLQAEVR